MIFKFTLLFLRGLIRRGAGEYEAKRISEAKQKRAQRKARAKASPTELSSSDLSCSICKRQFTAKIGLISHLRTHKSLRKHAYSNILKILSPKNENFQIKNSDFFHVSAQNIDCGYSLEPPRRGGSNEYPLAEVVLTSTHNLCF